MKIKGIVLLVALSLSANETSIFSQDKPCCDLKNQIAKAVSQNNIEFIELSFTDAIGRPKSLEIPVEALEDCIKNGVEFDGSSVTGFGKIEQSDMTLKLDLNTFVVLPDNKTKTGRIVCDVYDGNKGLFSGAPRSILKKTIEEAKELGIEFKVGPELEFYIFQKDKKNKIKIPDFDKELYFDNNPANKTKDIRKEIMTTIRSMGIKPEKTHHEAGYGQHEVNFKYDTPLKMADNIILLKEVIKNIVHKHGLIASFMPKPLYQKAGSGMHVNFSISDLKTRAPLFFDKNAEYNISNIAKYFIAGQLKYVREMSLILNPSVNSYKRLVPGFESPIFICWAKSNRSSLIRIPQNSPDRPSSTRAELRNTDPSGCPYLIFAAMLKAGIEGIKNELELPEELTSNAYKKTKAELDNQNIETLPKSLKEALELFKTSKICKELLGEKYFEKYISLKEKETKDFDEFVTNWELDKYLDA